MTNLNLSRDHLTQAQARKDFLRIAFEKRLWAVVIRTSQEVVELSLKAALRFVGVEPPKWHDVGEVLLREQARFPSGFQNEIPFLCKVSSKLRDYRELSLYGDSEKDIPASELFSERDADEAKEQSEKIVALCERLVQ